MGLHGMPADHIIRQPRRAPGASALLRPITPEEERAAVAGVVLCARRAAAPAGDVREVLSALGLLDAAKALLEES
jgi:hypothetical protein